MKGPRGRLLLCALVLIAPGAAPRPGSALAALTASTRACIGPPDTCTFSPPMGGPGASSSILQSYGGGGSEFLTEASASMTLPDYDGFGTRAGVTAAASTADRISYPLGTTGWATGLFQDVITVGGASGSGIFREIWHVTGATDVGFTASPGVPVETSVELNFTCFSQLAGTITFLECADPAYTWSSIADVDEMVVIDIPIVFGTPIQYNLTVDLIASVFFNLAGAGQQSFEGQAIGEFGSTGELVEVQILDGVGNPVAADDIVSESLFRYDLVAVPEPGALVLAPTLAFVFGLAAALRRRPDPRPRLRRSN